MMMKEDRVAVVTGGAKGIGRCICKEFIKAGCKVCVIDVEDASDIYKEEEGNLFFKGDIASKTVLEEFHKKVVTKYAKIDYLINNACISKGGVLNCSYEDFLYVQQIGVVAPFMLTKLFLPHFSLGGAVVNIASTRAMQSQKNTESYTSAKGGIVALTHALAVSASPNIRVNCISPGWINTTNAKLTKEDKAQHPSGRVGTPKDIAHAVMFLCSEQATFINGENIVIDGGMSKLMVYSGDEGWRLG